jgi:anti-sigma28 factor (negative regulator of flagellin synthesis)
MLTKENIKNFLKDNMKYILYILAAIFLFYMLTEKKAKNVAPKPKELPKPPQKPATEDEINKFREMINKAADSENKLESFSQIPNPPEFMKQRILELKEDIENGQIAKKVLTARGIKI